MVEVNTEQGVVQNPLCRSFGKCPAGDQLDREVGTLIGVRGPVGPKLFTYMRYNGELTRAGLDALELQDIDPKNVQTTRLAGMRQRFAASRSSKPA